MLSIDELHDYARKHNASSHNNSPRCDPELKISTRTAHSNFLGCNFLGCNFLDRCAKILEELPKLPKVFDRRRRSRPAG